MRVLFLAVVLMWVVLPAFGAEEAGETLHFPSEVPVGEIVQYSDSFYNEAWWMFYGGDKAAPPAQGEVVVPAGKRWVLRLDQEVQLHPDRLDLLTADMPEIVSIRGADSNQLNRLLPYLRRFSHLHTLFLHEVEMESADLGPLMEIPSLKALGVVSDTLGERGCAQIGRVKQLERLRIWGRPGFSNNSLSAIGGLEHLGWLALEPFTAAGGESLSLQHLAGLRDLHYLSLSGSLVDSEVLAGLKLLPSLEQLRLRCDALSEKRIAELGRVSTLKQLTLDCNVTPDGLREFARCNPSIESLEFCMGVSDEHVAELETLQSLRALLLSSTIQDTMPYLDDSGFASIGRLRNLEDLQIFLSGRTSDEGLKSLGGLTKLRLLDIGNRAPLTDDQMVYFTHMPSLESLKFRASEVGDAGLEVLKDVKSLHKLILFAGSRASDEGIANLEAAIPGLEVTDGLSPGPG